MRCVISISAILILIGSGLLIHATKWPVYTDEKAPARLADELEPKGDFSKDQGEANFDQWFTRLQMYETPYKKVSDLGRGLISAGLGLLLAGGIWSIYHRYAWMRTRRSLLSIWLILWALRMPLSVWYYTLRHQRNDYPWWGDSIAIGIVQDCVTWIFGGILSSILLLILLKRYALPEKVIWAKPGSTYQWLRFAFFACWIGLLAQETIWNIPYGDEGSVLTVIPAAVILLIFLFATEVKKQEESTEAMVMTSPSKA